MEKISLKEAIALVGDGATYRTINYYKGIYSSDVVKIGTNYFVNESFIQKVKKNRLNNRKTISEPRTKEQLLKELDDKQKEIDALKTTIAEYENSEVYEKANEGFRVELFTQEEYSIFEERLIQWRLQRQEIESTRVHFESLKDEKDFIKGQLEYFKNSNDKILQQHQNLIEIIGQRNRIEAVEKGAISKEPREI